MTVYNKLVRDGILRKIMKNRTPLERLRRVKPMYRILSPEEFRDEALPTKLTEEVKELREAIASHDRAKILEELADVQDVTDAIRITQCISTTELMGEQARKGSLNGGFLKRIFLISFG
ncbi:MAG TPA: nucleoside triphosphate pyrophosphohydrolase [Candidatus Paceibacterota bacterium]|nr:nucleoside triphosphate pyrophosphohydrolase [Candidatus Paceibacterota bacterium]